MGCRRGPGRECSGPASQFNAADHRSCGSWSDAPNGVWPRFSGRFYREVDDSGVRDMATHPYVPALDGVRALAVTAVLCFHGGLPWAAGGFLGVDAFFVLSGYLITMLLFTEWQRTRRIDAVAFWGRRARRLLPALLVMVAVVAVTAPRLVSTAELGPLRADGWATLLYVNNWQMISNGGDYFAVTAAPSPFEHTWSLAIEEQFYLVWPVLLVVLLRGRIRDAACWWFAWSGWWRRRSRWARGTTRWTRAGPTTAPKPAEPVCWWAPLWRWRCRGMGW